MNLSYQSIADIQQGLAILAQKTEDNSFRDNLIKDGKFTAEEFFRLSFLISRFIKASKVPLDYFVEQKNLLLRKCGAPEITDNKPTDRFIIAEDKLGLYNSAISTLLELDQELTNVRKFTLSELEKLGVGSVVLVSLDSVIDGDVIFE